MTALPWPAATHSPTTRGRYNAANRHAHLLQIAQQGALALIPSSTNDVSASYVHRDSLTLPSADTIDLLPCAPVPMSSTHSLYEFPKPTTTDSLFHIKVRPHAAADLHYRTMSPPLQNTRKLRDYIYGTEQEVATRRTPQYTLAGPAANPMR